MHGRRPWRLSWLPVALSQVDLIWTDQTAQPGDWTFSGRPFEVSKSTRCGSGSEEAVARGSYAAGRDPGRPRASCSATVVLLTAQSYAIAWSGQMLGVTLAAEYQQMSPLTLTVTWSGSPGEPPPSKAGLVSAHMREKDHG